MIIDTSALIAILWKEPDAARLIASIDADPSRLMSVGSVLEAALVAQGRGGGAAERELDVLIQRISIELVSVTAEQCEIARSGYRRFGKGRHPAGLNYGDCFSYALAIVADEPLLFTGGRFSKTDVRVA